MGILCREELRALRMVSSILQNEMSLEARYFPQYYPHYMQTAPTMRTATAP